MEGALRYHHPQVDLSNEDNAHTQLILLTGTDKKVLEVGPATGYLSQVMRERGCRVTGVEIDPHAAAIASEFCERVVVGSIEQLDLAESFGTERFDVVMFGDVLEHLVDPHGVLVNVQRLLAPGGYVVASIPNVAHGSVRLALLGGKFNYTETGLLDRTHLRFFTRDSIADLFASAGYEITGWHAVKMDPLRSEQELRYEDFPPVLVEAINGDPDAMTYQFVVTASPLGWPSAGSSTDGHGLEARGDTVLRHLVARDAVERRFVADAQASKREVGRLQMELAAKDAELVRATGRIAEIESSTGWRALNALRPYARVLAPRGSFRSRAMMALGRFGFRALRAPVRLARRIRRRPRLDAAVQVAVLVPPKPKVARLRFGCYGEHCWSVGGGAVHALQLLIPLSRYYETELLLPPHAPLRDKEWYRENLLIDIGDIQVRHYSPGLENTYDVWLSVWNERIWPAPTPKRFNMVFFPFVSLDGAGYTHITNGEYSARYTRERYRTPDVLVIPPCVDVHEFATGPKEGMILHVSRFSLPSAYADKAHVMMIQAFKQLCDRGLNGWKLVLAGATLDDGEATYAAHLGKHSAGYPVEFALNLSAEELRDLFKRASIYWHATGYSVNEPAAQEHFGITIIEGMAAGAVPVVYDSGGPPEIITSGESGYLFDSIEQLMEHTWNLAHQPELWRRMSLAARERAAFFSPEMVEERMARAVAGTDRVSIIIGTHDNVVVLRRAIGSILEHTPAGYELIVVANECSDATELYLASVDYPGLSVIHNETNESFAAFNNRGQAAAGREYILYLNDDIEAFPGWIEPLIDTLDRQPKIGAVGSRLLYPDGRVQHDGKMFRKRDLEPVHVNMGGQPVEDESPIEVDALTGACLMVRRDLAGFSEDYKRGYYEDTDLCMRIKERGYGLMLHRGSVLIHYHGMTMGRNQPATEEAQRRNREIFMERWAEKLPDLVYLASDHEIETGEIRCRPTCPPDDGADRWPRSRRLQT